MKRFFCIAIVAAILSSCGGGSDSRVPPSGPFAVGTSVVELVDETRPTAENRGVPGKPTRRFVTRLYYPAEGDPGAPHSAEIPNAPPARLEGPYPLIVFVHGMSALPEVYRFLLVGWARAGYFVVAPNMPLTNGAAEGGPNAVDFLNQPEDVSFLISEALALSSSEDPYFGGMIDRSRIGVSGQSLGGMTTLGVAANSCCLDERIDAAVAMAARAVDLPGGSHDRANEAPILLIHGDVDETVPYAEGRAAFDELRPPKALITILGGDHIFPYVADPARPDTLPNREGSLAFFDLYLKGDRGALDRLRELGELANTEVELVLP